MLDAKSISEGWEDFISIVDIPEDVVFTAFQQKLLMQRSFYSGHTYFMYRIIKARNKGGDEGIRLLCEEMFDELREFGKILTEQYAELLEQSQPKD